MNIPIFILVIIAVTLILICHYYIDKAIIKQQFSKLNLFQSNLKVGDDVLLVHYDHLMNPYFTKIHLLCATNNKYDFEYILNGSSYEGIERYELYPLNWNDPLIIKILNTIKKLWKKLNQPLEEDTIS